MENELHPIRVSVTTGDGFLLNAWDYGGEGPALLLCHCTGTLARLWDVVIRHLGGQFRVISYDTRGHGDSQPLMNKGDCAWHLSGRDIHAVLDAFALNDPVFGVGHSAGAAHIAYAEDIFPGRFDRVMLIDAIIGPYYLFQGEHPLSESARRRTNLFESTTQARERFSSKLPMQRWVRDCLELYLQHGLFEQSDGKVGLKLPGEREAWFYELGGASDLFERLESLCFKAMLVSGGESTVSPLVAAQSELLPNARKHIVAGASHFIPQEKPASVASLILEYFGEA